MPRTAYRRLVTWLDRTLPSDTMPWQRKLAEGLWYSPEVALTMGRGGGKTATVGALAAAAVSPDGPLHHSDVDVVIVASVYDQANILYGDVYATLQKIHDLDSKEWRAQQSAGIAMIAHKSSGARVRCIGSNPRSAHGMRPSIVLADEPAQWAPNRAEAMVAAVETGLGKRSMSKFVALGTRPDLASSHWFSDMLARDDIHVADYSAHHDDDPFDSRTWIKAIPSLPHMPNLWAKVEMEARAAMTNPAKLQSFRALRLNMGVLDTVEHHLVDPALWRRCEGETPRRGICIWGVDLGTSAAMSAVAAFWPESGRLEVMASFPTEPALSERANNDGVGTDYAVMAERGELILTGGRATDIGQLMREAHSRFGRPAAIVADRWRVAELTDSLDRANVPAADLVTRGQGYRDGGEDVELFRRSCLQGEVTAETSLLLRSAISKARCVSDPAGNSKLAKGSEGHRSNASRDDAAAAAILAVAEGARRSRVRSEDAPTILVAR